VRAELRHDRGDTLVEPELAAFEEQPDGGRDYGLRAREDVIERVVGRRLFAAALDCRAEGAHAGELAVARDRHLRAGEDAVVDVPLRPREHRLEALRLDAEIFGL